MAGTLKPFQSYGPKQWKGLTTENSLAALALRKQQAVSDMMVRVMAWKYGNVLDTLMSKFATKVLETSDEYTWKLQGPSKRNYPLLEARDGNGTVITDTTSMFGANQAPFYLVFNEDWTWRGATIVGNLNEAYQFVVLDEPRYEGANTIYRVSLSGANTEGIPGERLLAGEKFSFEANYVSDDFNREVGDLNFASHAEMKNEFSTIRSKYKVGGKMMDDKLAVGLPVWGDDGKVKVVNKWMLYVDFLFERQFRDQKNNALAYGVSNRNANGEYMDYDVNGRVIKKSAGLYQQIELGNTMYINKFSLKVLEKALLGLFSGKVDYNNRHVVLMTGDAGAMDFHKAILNETQGWSQFDFNGDALGVMKKVSSPYHQNALSAGYQFTQYRSPMGIVIDLLVDQSYNDPVRNKITMQDGSLAYSHRMDIMDLGPSDQPNIFKVLSKAQPEVRGYQAGPFGNPFTGEVGNTHASYDEDSAVAHKKATIGICVLDPTKTVSIIPNVLRA